MKVRNIFQTCQKYTIKTTTTVFNNLAVHRSVQDFSWTGKANT